MYGYVVLFALVSSTLAGILPFNDELDGRIVNGVETTIEARPYQISLQRNGAHSCGGSIINEDTIVTAAHCLQNVKPSQLKVRLGSTNHNSGGEYVTVRAFKNHEGYNRETNQNDVAIIKLASPVRESSRIRYIGLTDKTPVTGTPAVVSGWGVKCFFWCASLPTALQEVEINVVDKEDCASSAYKYGSKIQDTMVCGHAEQKDSCQGDSGGPLVSGNKLVGIVSWGNGCAREGYPGVYCDVASVRKWILDMAAIL